jgi:hypothetical protein
MVKLELQDGNASALITVPEPARLQVRRDADAHLSAPSTISIGSGPRARFSVLKGLRQRGPQRESL